MKAPDKFTIQVSSGLLRAAQAWNLTIIDVVRDHFKRNDWDLEDLKSYNVELTESLFDSMIIKGKRG